METINSGAPKTEKSSSQTPTANYPAFDPNNAERLRGEAFFKINPADYPIFSRQAGYRKDPNSNKWGDRTLGINETLGLMVGRTAEVVTTLTGEYGTPVIDHAIYLDKSARPVSWLVDEFWEDFTDKPRPEKTFLAIDRRTWFPRVGIHIDDRDYFTDEHGVYRMAMPKDFKIEKIPRKDLARIRALYIEGGIESDSLDEENIEKIMNTPTVLKDKNVCIIDEVSRSGSTSYIATELIKAATDAKSVSAHVFWADNSHVINETDETQMGKTPVWYPSDTKDWRGRGVKDINESFYKAQYEKNPTRDNLARRFGAFVLGEPLINPEDEPGQPSWHLREEIQKMHRDYQAGHILPTISMQPPEKMIDQLEEWGVVFSSEDQPGYNPRDPRLYHNLMKKRDSLT